MPVAKPFRKFETAMRRYALKYPGSVEEFPWGHTVFKVKKKIFLIIGGCDDFISFSVKLPTSHRLALLLPYASPTGYGLGKSGWVTAQFKDGDAVPLERLCEWTDESYRAIAPKKFIAELDNPTVKPPAKPKRGR